MRTMGRLFAVVGLLLAAAEGAQVIRDRDEALFVAGQISASKETTQDVERLRAAYQASKAAAGGDPAPPMDVDPVMLRHRARRLADAPPRPERPAGPEDFPRDLRAEI